MRVVILGGSGAGKGTQAARLAQHFGLPLLSTGDLLRQLAGSPEPQSPEAWTEAGSDTKAGNPAIAMWSKQAQPYLERGELVPDEVMISLMRQRLLEPEMSQGWILEGYPRTAFQAEELDFLLEELNQSLDRALWLEVPETVLVERSLSRARSDDTLETIQRRIQATSQFTAALQDYYGYRGLLTIVNGHQPIDAVEQTILRQLQS